MELAEKLLVHFINFTFIYVTDVVIFRTFFGLLNTPSVFVEASILNGFCKMLPLNGLFIFNICDGACYPDDSVISSSAQVVFVHGIL